MPKCYLLAYQLQKMMTIGVPIINRVEQEIKTFIAYYKFITKKSQAVII